MRSGDKFRAKRGKFKGLNDEPDTWRDLYKKGGEELLREYAEHRPIGEKIMFRQHVLRILSQQVLTAFPIKIAPRVRIIIKPLELPSLRSEFIAKPHDVNLLRVKLYTRPSEGISETLAGEVLLGIRAAVTGRDSKFDVVAARDWLASVNSDDPALREMLSRVAKGEYVNINKKITKFVVELQRSKHGDNDAVMTRFFAQIVDTLILRLKINKITSDGLMKLKENVMLVKYPNIIDEIDSVIRSRNNSLTAE